MGLDSQLSYIIPDVADREGQLISFAAFEEGKSILPPFV
jgi:hypothetical protein